MDFLKLALMSLLLFSPFAFAGSYQTYRLSLGTKVENVDFYKSQSILITKKCEVADCMAKKAVDDYKNNKAKIIQKSTSFESDVCRWMKGSLRILEDKKLNQKNFCFFDDGSGFSLSELLM